MKVLRVGRAFDNDNWMEPNYVFTTVEVEGVEKLVGYKNNFIATTVSLWISSQ